MRLVADAFGAHVGLIVDFREQARCAVPRRACPWRPLRRAQGHDAVEQRPGQLQIVGDHDHAQPSLLAEARERPHQIGAVFQVERGRRLVEQQQARLLRQRAGQDHHLPLAGGKRGDGRAARCAAPAASSASMAMARFERPLEAEARDMRRPAAEHHVHHLERKLRHRGLRHVGDLARAQRACGQLSSAMPCEQNFPRAGRSRPASMRISVDLPEPLAPMTAVIEAGSIARLTPRTARALPRPAPPPRPGMRRKPLALRRARFIWPPADGAGGRTVRPSAPCAGKHA